MSLATLPESFAKPTSITDYLYLHDNRLQVLSDSVTSISATIRSVAFPFRWAPHQIRRARPGKYRHLDLRRNEFTTFSEVLRALPKLHKLDLRWSVCGSNLGDVFRAPRFPGRAA
jgi:hypothetical protein